jgi:hypothetical protein
VAEKLAGTVDGLGFVRIVCRRRTGSLE